MVAAELGAWVGARKGEGGVVLGDKGVEGGEGEEGDGRDKRLRWLQGGEREGLGGGCGVCLHRGGVEGGGVAACGVDRRQRYWAAALRVFSPPRLILGSVLTGGVAEGCASPPPGFAPFVRLVRPGLPC